MTSIKRRHDLCRSAPRFEASRKEAATLAPDRTAPHAPVEVIITVEKTDSHTSDAPGQRLGVIEHHKDSNEHNGARQRPHGILAFSAPSSTETPLALTARASASAANGIV
ncbi:hypothetical protein [Mesorhizobium sp.]|uniref:hypothetical protein n=1 Tax=Mesorhizobium sp. TaxID=1871066 RepID=UPI0025C14430|nr:hypothetical protein [Mesorhizobium sp.]